MQDWLSLPQLLAPRGTKFNIPHKSLFDFHLMYVGQITVDYLIAIFAQISWCGHASKLERYANQVYFQRGEAKPWLEPGWN